MCEGGLYGGLRLRQVKYQGGDVHGVHQEGTWTYILEDCRVIQHALGCDLHPPSRPNILFQLLFHPYELTLGGSVGDQR